jgi:benzoyl-CoA reductase/2-hydroxyglutaryl-CoA dehydratase subunit BcrC/BadD/HgdB
MIELPRRSRAISRQKGEGGRVAAVFPIHAPRALFRAYGFLPVEVWGPPGIDPSPAAAHIQPWLCSVVRTGLAFLLRGGVELSEIDLVVVPHACDALQGLGSLLLDLVPCGKPVVTFTMPKGCGPSAVDFLESELIRLGEVLGRSTGVTPTDDALLRAQIEEEDADRVTANLLAARPGMAVADAAFWPLLRRREFLHAPEYARLAGRDPAELFSSCDALVPAAAHRLVLSGIVPEPGSLYEAFSGCGASVVADDTAAIGRRVRKPGRSERPLRRMAEHLLSGPPDPTLGSPIQERLDHLRGLAAGSGAEGVVFYEPSSCEPELFDLPLLRKGLEETPVASTDGERGGGKALSSVAIQMDLSDPCTLSGQVLTRIEAFVESLQ